MQAFNSLGKGIPQKEVSCVQHTSQAERGTPLEKQTIKSEKGCEYYSSNKSKLSEQVPHYNFYL